MELIWGMWFFFGLIVGAVICFAVGSGDDERYVKGSSDRHSGNALSAGGNGRMDRGNKLRRRKTAEEINLTLWNIHKSASKYEKECIEDAIEIVEGSEE